MNNTPDGKISKYDTKITKTQELAKLLPVLERAVDGAIGIEAHDNRYYADFQTKAYYALLGGYVEENGIVPVRFGIKEDVIGNYNLYIIVGEGIKNAEIPTLRYQNNSENPNAPSAIDFNIAEIIKHVNNADILKNLPDQMLNIDQRHIKYATYSTKFFEYPESFCT